MKKEKYSRVMKLILNKRKEKNIKIIKKIIFNENNFNCLIKFKCLK